MFLNKLTAFFQPAVDRLSKLTIFQTRDGSAAMRDADSAGSEESLQTGPV